MNPLEELERKIVRKFLLKHRYQLARWEDTVNGEFTNFMEMERWLAMPLIMREERVWTDGTWIP